MANFGGYLHLHLLPITVLTRFQAISHHEWISWRVSRKPCSKQWTVTAKLVAALLRVARVTAGLAKSNSSLLPGLWLTSPAGWLPRTGISCGTLRSVIEYGLPFNANEVQLLHSPAAGLLSSSHRVCILTCWCVNQDTDVCRHTVRRWK